MSVEIKNSSSEHLTHLPVSEALLQDILEAPKGEVETYGATPLDRVATLAQQIDVRNNLQELTYRDVPYDVPLEILSYVHTVFAKRFDTRAEANEENFTTCLRYEDYQETLNPVVIDMIDRARFGHASPAELLLAREQLEMRSIELACLTHPYGVKIENLDDMRFAVEYATQLYGGEYFETPAAVFSIKESVSEAPKMPDLSRGMLMTRKRVLAKLPDGTLVKERSSFVLRTDVESGFDQAIIERLKQEFENDPTMNWQEWLIDQAGVGQMADELLVANEFSTAIPVSSTTYAYNTQTSGDVYASIEQKRAQALKEGLVNAPNLYEAMNDDVDAHRQAIAERSAAQMMIESAPMYFVNSSRSDKVLEDDESL